MTAYARHEITGKWGSASLELRSVNQRYLETSIRLPEQLRSLEPIIREHIRKHLTRGKVECNLRCELDANTQNTIFLNKKLAKQLIESANWVKMQSNEGEINPFEVLCWPGVMFFAEQNFDYISCELIQALNDAMNNFILAREKEGNVLKTLIEQRLNDLIAEVVKVRTQMPNILQWQRDRLASKFQALKMQLENSRLEQELILIAQRIDITEELDRLEAHVKETHSILQKREAVGRRLDFMMQEFNRESNTLASKSINANITASAIEIKVLIEQMREQIQNIE